MDFSISIPWFGSERVGNYSFSDGAIFTIQKTNNGYELTLSGVKNPMLLSFTVNVRYGGIEKNSGNYFYTGKAELKESLYYNRLLEGTVVLLSREKLSSFLKGRNLPEEERMEMLRSKSLFFVFENLQPASVGGFSMGPLNMTIGICPHESITDKEIKRRQQEAARNAELGRLAQLETARKKEEARAKRMAQEEQLKYIYREAIRQSDSLFNTMNDSLVQSVAQNHVKACFSEMNKLKSNYDIAYYQATDTGSIINITHVILLTSPDRAVPISSNGSFRMNKDKRQNKQVTYCKTDWTPGNDYYFYLSSPGSDKVYKHGDKMYLVRSIPYFKLKSYSATLGLMIKKKKTKYYPSYRSTLPAAVKHWCEQNIIDRGSYMVKYTIVNGVPYCAYKNVPIPGIMQR